MASQAYCNPDPSAPANNPCVSEIGGIISFGYMKKAAYTAWVDFEDNAEWLAAIAADDVFPLYDSRGESTFPEWQTDDDEFGESGTSIKGADFSVTVEHKGIHIGGGGSRTNINFYNNMVLKGGSFHVYWVDGGHNLWVSTSPVSVLPKVVLPKSRKDLEIWQVENKWSDNEIPQSYDAPDITYIAP